MQNLAGSALFLPQGDTHFQLVPLGSPQGYFMDKFSPLTSIKFLPPNSNAPPSISDPNYSPLKKLKRLEKIDFQHTTITPRMQYLAQVSQPRECHIYQKCYISNPGGTILTKNVLFPNQGAGF